MTRGRRDAARSDGELFRLRELMDMQVTDAVWGEIIRGLVDVAAGGEKGAIQAAKLLLSYRFGAPTQQIGGPEAPPIEIHTIEARLRERKKSHTNRTRQTRRKDGTGSPSGSMESVEVETTVRGGHGGDAGR